MRSLSETVSLLAEKGDVDQALRLIRDCVERIAIAAIPYELAWGEVGSAEDLMAYQEAGTRRAIK